jgi:hypothetical protein
MAKAEEYRGCAALCLKMANAMAESTDKAVWLSMAQWWRKLAKQAAISDAGLA